LRLGSKPNEEYEIIPLFEEGGGEEKEKEEDEVEKGRTLGGGRSTCQLQSASI